MIAGFNKKANKESSNEDIVFQALGIIFLIIIVVLIFSDIKIYQKKKQLASQIITYQQEVEDLKKSSQNLKEEIANSDNKDYLEKVAYEQLNEARPGETVYSFISSKEKPKTVVKPQNFLESWLGQLSGGFNWIKSQF